MDFLLYLKSVKKGYFSVSVLLLASVKRVSVTHMRDFFYPRTKLSRGDLVNINIKFSTRRTCPRVKKCYNLKFLTPSNL